MDTKKLLKRQRVQQIGGSMQWWSHAAALILLEIDIADIYSKFKLQIHITLRLLAKSGVFSIWNTASTSRGNLQQHFFAPILQCPAQQTCKIAQFGVQYQTLKISLAKKFQFLPIRKSRAPDTLNNESWW